MATKTFEELKQLAIQIRDEKTNKQNTATRVGTAMLEHINKLEQDYYDKNQTDEELKERDDKLTELEMLIGIRPNSYVLQDSYTESNGFIDKQGTLYSGNEKYKYTSPISLKSGQMILIYSLLNTSIAVISEYIDGVYKPLIVNGFNTAAIRINYVIAHRNMNIVCSYPTNNDTKIYISSDISATIKHISDLSSKVYTLDDKCNTNILELCKNIDKSTLQYNNGFIGNDGNKYSSDNRFFYTNPIAVQAGENFIFFGRLNFSICTFTLYSDDEYNNVIDNYKTEYNGEKLISYKVVKDGYLVISGESEFRTNNEYYLLLDKTNIGHKSFTNDEIDIIKSEIENSTIGNLMPCFGDSLIAGGAGGLPSFTIKLQELLGTKYKVINCGVGGETIQVIAARQGCAPMMNKNEFILPADTSDVILGTTREPFINAFNEPVIPLFQGEGQSFNPIYVDGIECNLRLSTDATGYDRNYIIKRTEEGESERTISPNTLFATKGSMSYRNPAAAIYWFGTNGTWDTVDILIKWYDRFIEFSGTSNYIIIGLHYSNFSDKFEEMEEKFTKKYGLHYINWRKYGIEHGLQDAGIEPTEQDNENISQGLFPSSLLVDTVHLTEKGNELLINQIIQRMKYLGL